MQSLTAMSLFTSPVAASPAMHDVMRRYHSRHKAPGQCRSANVQYVAAPLPVVWSLLRRLDRPQGYKRFLKGCRLRAGVRAAGGDQHGAARRAGRRAARDQLLRRGRRPPAEQLPVDHVAPRGRRSGGDRGGGVVRGGRASREHGGGPLQAQPSVLVFLRENTDNIYCQCPPKCI
ncbi:unnamed protein product, partial [Musa acuminata var. zebrina]